MLTYFLTEKLDCGAKGLDILQNDKYIEYLYRVFTNYFNNRRTFEK